MGVIIQSTKNGYMVTATRGTGKETRHFKTLEDFVNYLKDRRKWRNIKKKCEEIDDRIVSSRMSW